MNKPSTASPWRLVNAAVLVVVLAANALAATGRMSGSSIGAIANRTSSYFLPADYVFSIWSLIYVGLLAFTVFQLLPGPAGRRAVERLGPWWLVSGVLNIAWVSAFCFSQFGLAMVAMLALLGTLIVISERLRPLVAASSLAERLCVAWPFSIYLAWISVALIANTFQYAHVVGWGGLGIAEEAWAAGMMVVATLLGWLLVVRRGLWLFPVVVAWAVWGIGARHALVPLVHGTALVVVPLGLAVGLGAAAWLRRRPVVAAPVVA
jgi:translocator protein